MLMLNGRLIATHQGDRPYFYIRALETTQTLKKSLYCRMPYNTKELPKLFYESPSNTNISISETTTFYGDMHTVIYGVSVHTSPLNLDRYGFMALPNSRRTASSCNFINTYALATLTFLLMYTLVVFGLALAGIVLIMGTVGFMEQGLAERHSTRLSPDITTSLLSELSFKGGFRLAMATSMSFREPGQLRKRKQTLQIFFFFN